ncbi:hypothetical protein NRE95_005300 [Salmonella enterica]|nr:hypothetical protein [Salmonella enterica]
MNRMSGSINRDSIPEEACNEVEECELSPQRTTKATYHSANEPGLKSVPVNAPSRSR